MELEKYSMGVGDRLFGFECSAQLRALQKAAADGIRIVPVWNKSNREHLLTGTVPVDSRKAADAAVRSCQWTDSYYVDADHIGLATVDAFLPSSDFFTIDVADFIGDPMHGRQKSSFLSVMTRYKGSHKFRGLPPRSRSQSAHSNISQTLIASRLRKPERFITTSQKKRAWTVLSRKYQWTRPGVRKLLSNYFSFLPVLPSEGVPIQTIAPKFTGSFLKGIDYVGDPRQFSQEFDAYLAVISYAASKFDLPGNLKLSIHTGSDKFTLYPIIHRAIKRMDTGVHLKTAGTTWLEEVIGLAASGGAGLEFAKEIYRESYLRRNELCKAYLAVINIEEDQLPPPAEVASWGSKEFVSALQHDPLCKDYNPHLRQLIHVGFKVAAEMKLRFTELLVECRVAIEDNVTRNLYERHIRPLFLGF